MPNQERLRALRNKMAGKGLDAVLILKPENCRYLSNFTGSSGVILVTTENAFIFTDFRYLLQAGEEAAGFTLVEWKDPVWDTFGARAKSLGIKNFGFEADVLTVSRFSKIRQTVEPVEMVEVKGLVEELRLLKNEEEIGRIRQAAAIADGALDYILPQIKPGIRERELAIEADCFMRKKGAEMQAFETIVASGRHSCLPHASPTEKVLEKGDLVLIDLGARYQGYHSDMSRTFVRGSPTEEQKRLYEVVRLAQQAALEAVKEGKKAAEVDAVARTIIAEAGWGENFGHGTGHGVGLEVHEAPRIGPKSEEELKAGMVFTIEPAVYLPEIGGVRIEDTVLLGEQGVEVLTRFSKELMVL